MSLPTRVVYAFQLPIAVSHAYSLLHSRVQYMDSVNYSNCKSSNTLRSRWKRNAFSECAPYVTICILLISLPLWKILCHNNRDLCNVNTHACIPIQYIITDSYYTYIYNAINSAHWVVINRYKKILYDVVVYSTGNKTIKYTYTILRGIVYYMT